MSLKSGKLWLLTVALVVAPMSSVILILYGAGRLVMRSRLKTRLNPYADWFTARDRTRTRVGVAPGDD